MKLASAQINSTIGEIQQNLNEHYRIIKIAIENNVQLILFPEMSITGYCRDEAEKLSFSENDSRLTILQDLSTQGNIIIVAGAPIRIKENLHIGSFIIYPKKSIKIYIKQYLHGEEDLFYTSSMDYNPIINIGTQKISLAICADINNEKHPCQAEKNNCSMYLPSIFYSESGMNTGFEQLKSYAEKYSLNILMSNYSGKLWGMKSGGKSAFWNSKGQLMNNLNSNEIGILIIENNYNIWNTKKLITTPSS